MDCLHNVIHLHVTQCSFLQMASSSFIYCTMSAASAIQCNITETFPVYSLEEE